MELIRALAVLAETPGEEQRHLGGLLNLPGEPDPADFADLFLFQLYPYAAVYLGAEGMLGGEAQDRIAGFWRALRLDPPAEPDHLASLLGLYTALAEGESAEPDEARRVLRRQARAALFFEHLASWVFAYLDKFSEIAPPFYRAWAELLDRTLREEAAGLPAPAGPPSHFRELPPSPPDDGDPEALLDFLLAPARSGLILVRTDLARAGQETDQGMRIGQRRFVLRAFLRQEPVGARRWLAGEAVRWTERHRVWAGIQGAGPAGSHWVERAAATAEALEAAVAERVGNGRDEPEQIEVGPGTD